MGERQGSDADGQLLQLPARFWKKVDQNGPIPERAPHLGPCWLWRGALDQAGYGVRVPHNGIRQYPHRLSYQAGVGPIPDGMEVDHLCCVRNCVRFDHLEAVVHAENQRRMGAIRTHCMWDHELTGDNVYIDAKTGNRRCRACNARRQRKLHAKRFAAGAMPPPDAHCKYGHPYEVDPQGRWFCHTCRNRRQREWKARKRGQEQG